MNKIYLSLGSNLGEREKFLSQAIASISIKIGNLKKLSGIYETEPWGFDATDKFLNMAIEIETDKTPDELIKLCLSIEEELGRQRQEGFGYSSRTIDIDVLFYENLILSTPELTIPHPHLQHRKFILKPLDEIAPDFEHPIFNKTVGELLEQCSDSGQVKYIGPLPS